MAIPSQKTSTGASNRFGAWLLAQRIYGLELGCEDVNDHNDLRLDPLLAAACNKSDPLGEDRFNPAHREIALAGSSTLNRLELSNNRNSRCHKLPHNPAQIEAGPIHDTH